LLENILWQEGNTLGNSFTVIAGLPNNKLYNKKLNKLLEILNVTYSTINDYITDSTYIISEFYKMIGLYLNTIIDKIINDEINLFKFDTQIYSDIRKNTYIY
jgi:hypothetical protein